VAPVSLLTEASVQLSPGLVGCGETGETAIEKSGA